MKAQNFRIGNLVQNSKGEIFKIALLDVENKSDRSIRAWSIDENKAFGCSDEMIEPIPLTDEWLIKLGFEEKEDSEGWWQNGIVFYNGIIAYQQKRKIKYVHKLQNIYFELTEEELKLKNE